MNGRECSIAADEYLGRHLEPKKEQEAQQHIPFFKDNFGWSFGGQDESFSHCDGEKGLSFDCQYMEEDFIDQLRKLMYAKFTSQKDREVYQKFFTPPMFVLRGLRAWEEKGDGYKLDLQPYLIEPNKEKQKELVVIVQPANVNVDEEVLNQIMGKGVIFLSGNLTDLDTLLALAHEVGHQEAKVRASEAMIGYQRGRPISKMEGMSVLQEERDAWAFAIKALKPFIPRERFADINKLIHNDALTSHSNHIRGQIAPDLVAAVCRFIDAKVRKWEKEQSRKDGA